jgi:intracellular sulfur oxidation DsrE/DsrF family protein
MDSKPMGSFLMFKSLVFALCGMVALVLGAALTPASAADGFKHHVVFHVDENDAAKMNLTLNNAANVAKYYEGKGEKVQVEIVTYGPGINMLRADTSPVAARMETFGMEYENVSFAACGNTLAGMTKKEGKEPPLLKLDNISVVPSGVVQLIERQDQGWKYIRP